MMDPLHLGHFQIFDSSHPAGHGGSGSLQIIRGSLLDVPVFYGSTAGELILGPFDQKNLLCEFVHVCGDLANGRAEPFG